MNAIFAIVAFMILFSSIFLASMARAEPVFEKGGNAKDNNAKAEIPPGARNSDDLCHKAQCREGVNLHDNNKKDDNKFFRGHNNEIKDTSVIPQTNSATTTTTNRTTATANVTIPICNGVVGGPCLDPNTHTIIP